MDVIRNIDQNHGKNTVTIVFHSPEDDAVDRGRVVAGLGLLCVGYRSAELDPDTGNIVGQLDPTRTVSDVFAVLYQIQEPPSRAAL